MSNVTKYKVSIFGESYFLVSDESQEHIDAVAFLVDSYMREIAEKNQIAQSKRIAVLVALQLASKALASQEKSDNLLVFMDKELSNFSPL